MDRETAVERFFQRMDGSTNLGHHGPLRVATSFTTKNGERVLHVTMKNVPFSGGTHMMPNGFRVLDTLNSHNCHHEAQFSPTGETHPGSAQREKKQLDLFVYFD